MSDQGDEGQVPEPPGLEGRELPPRPTVRESVRRGLFVRLPSEGDAEEGVAGAEQAAEGGQDIADQYPEQVADPYPGWRQAADGSWEAVGPEAYEYSESAEQAPAAPYLEPDQSANFASVAGGEPFIHEEASAEAPTWTFTPEQEVSQAAEEAVVPVTPQSPEVVSGVMPDVSEVVEETTAESVFEAPAPESAPAPEEAAEAVAAPVAEEFAEPVAETVAEATPEATPEAAPETAAAAEDPVAAAGLYIPSGVELLEEDMPLFGDKEKVPPRFAGSGLGEPCFIEFGDLGETLAGLRRLLPKGTRLTYNYDFERAWIRSTEGIDLPSFVERIGASADEGEATSS